MLLREFQQFYSDEQVDDYDSILIAYKREKKARELAEKVLESRASNLYKVNQLLNEQYVRASRRNQEFDYLLNVTKIDVAKESRTQSIRQFLEYTSILIWAEASFCFQCQLVDKKIQPISSFMINIDTNYQRDYECQFKNEKFDFLINHISKNETFLLSDFQRDLAQVNVKYKAFNFSYAFFINVDNDEKYMFWFTFSNPTELSRETIELIERGLSQLKASIGKHKAQELILLNYKKLKEMKSQLIQSEKMASIGMISAGIAHEINNPLSFLLTNTEVLREYLENLIEYVEILEKNNLNKGHDVLAVKKKNIDYILGDTPGLIRESLEGISRIKEIVQGLRTFSRADDGELKDFDINQCLEASLKLVSNELKHKCKIEKKLENVPNIHGSPGQLIQVFTNLLVNSAQAIEDFGLIRVSSREEGDGILVSVSDTGKGITKENLGNLFTPFFTTKPTGQGTGLGLSISYGIIKKHLGRIWVESEVGLGTTFYIKIPTVRSL